MGLISSRGWEGGGSGGGGGVLCDFFSFLLGGIGSTGRRRGGRERGREGAR